MTSPKGQAYRRCEPREWHLPQPKKDYCPIEAIEEQ